MIIVISRVELHDLRIIELIKALLLDEIFDVTQQPNQNKTIFCFLQKKV
jgi:hypothetical protein